MVRIVWVLFLVNFGLPGGVGVQNPLLAIKSIYLFVLFTSPLFVNFYLGELWAPQMNVLLGFEDFNYHKRLG
jgi:hypothetical protein